MKTCKVHNSKFVKMLIAVIILITSFNLYGGSKNSASAITNEAYREFVDELASPTEGQASLAGRIKYPKAAFQAGFEGKVVAKVYVNETGIVDKVEFIKKMGAGVEEQIKNVLEDTRFTPGKFNGEAVKSISVLTFKFEIRK